MKNKGLDVKFGLVNVFAEKTILVIRLHSVSADKEYLDDPETSTILEGDKMSVDLTHLPVRRYHVEYWPDKNIGLKAQPSNS